MEKNAINKGYYFLWINITIVDVSGQNNFRPVPDPEIFSKALTISLNFVRLQLMMT